MKEMASIKKLKKLVKYNNKTSNYDDWWVIMPGIHMVVSMYSIHFTKTSVLICFDGQRKYVDYTFKYSEIGKTMPCKGSTVLQVFNK